MRNGANIPDKRKSTCTRDLWQKRRTFKKLKEDYYICVAKIKKKPSIRESYKDEQGADHTGPSRPCMQRSGIIS